jgi:CHAT domain-containing protein
MRRLVIAALSALILLCVSVSTPQGRGLHSIRLTPLMINLLIRGVAPTATSLRPVATPAQTPANERGAATSALVPERERMQALDFEASRTTALRPELGEYRIVHFDTHGMLNNVHPELSGIVLSLVDKEGRPQDGFLRLQDIYNLKLPAELVVLSACQTGLGKEIKGEGLIGLTRGFMYAGAPRIVASLWKVDDRATSELMKRFYQGLLGPEALRSAGALRQAQLSILKKKQWREPYYWAAFVLQGEWK